MKLVTDSESSSETSETYHDGPAVVDHENVYAQNITCDAAFKFYKVGKASPSLEHRKKMHLPTLEVNWLITVISLVCHW